MREYMQSVCTLFFALQWGVMIMYGMYTRRAHTGAQTAADHTNFTQNVRAEAAKMSRRLIHVKLLAGARATNLRS